jgi:hypothetical protein
MPLAPVRARRGAGARIPDKSADELLARMPKAAVANLREHALQAIRRELEIVLAREVPQEIVRAGSSKWRVTDHRPVNGARLV